MECSKIPEVEIGKFLQQCQTVASGTGTQDLAVANGRMDVIRMQRNAVFAEIEALHQRRAQLLAREAELSSQTPPEDRAALSQVLGSLDTALKRKALVEQMASALAYKADGLPAVDAIRFARLSAGARIRSEANSDAPVIYTVSGEDEAIIHLQTGQMTDFQPVVQTGVGLGYVESVEIGAN